MEQSCSDQKKEIKATKKKATLPIHKQQLEATVKGIWQLHKFTEMLSRFLNIHECWSSKYI